MVERDRFIRAFSSSKRSKFIQRDKDGVASTVGTIMALMVFLTFLTLFTNTYVPVWMKDNEKNHMDLVMNQIGDLKSKVDSLVVNAQVTGRSTVTMYQPFKLGADGIPVFASPTAGLLSLKPRGTYDSSVHVQFDYVFAQNDNRSYDEYGGGCVEFYGPNRYYVQQWYAFENGAIMIAQEDGMAVRATPTLEFQKDVGISMMFNQVDIISENSSVAGIGSAGINLDLIYHDVQTYTIVDASDVVITFTTRYYEAWESAITNATTLAGMTENDFEIQKNIISPLGVKALYDIVLTVHGVTQFDYNIGYVTMKLEY